MNNNPDPIEGDADMAEGIRLYREEGMSDEEILARIAKLTQEAWQEHIQKN